MSAALAHTTYEHGDRLQSAGYALDALADLLGGGGPQHHLTPAHLNGLINAVRVIGWHIADAGIELCEHSAALATGGEA